MDCNFANESTDPISVTNENTKSNTVHFTNLKRCNRKIVDINVDYDLYPIIILCYIIGIGLSE